MKLLGEEMLLDEKSLQNAMMNRDHWLEIYNAMTCFKFSF